MKKIKYYIIIKDQQNRLQNEVNRLIKLGYQPYGYLNALYTGKTPAIIYSQAMVLYEEDSEQKD